MKQKKIATSAWFCSTGKESWVFRRLSERSPTALVVTLELLRHNEDLPIEDVFKADLEAARFIMSHPDYLEGVRARLIDKDDNPRWQPDSIEKVASIDLNLS
ncbi:MAG: enoyl-CoA hydratase/isomerase family protein [Deltaproteobacteria bacterium]|nr:enoyl-CoA hydratase/isomerase family protein [Deltaproteobacteria bacterium]MBW2199974.1 enoyl-CoA hydratase/isomerase family protein [Deltaproteobacteria bacterium]MBW2538531.1 enoyl-CoA hydratase/isomerase family protein [Deltaproteobacteria bacterium]